MENRCYSWNKNIFLLVMSVLAGLSFYNCGYLYILISFAVLMLITGNIQRIYIRNHKDVGRLIRRLLYEVPLIISAFFFRIGVEFNIVTLISCGCFAIAIGIYFFIRKRDYRLLMSYSVLRLGKEESYFQYISRILQIIAAVIGEEIFFRGFMFDVVEYSLYMVPIGAVLFTIYHTGNGRGKIFRTMDIAIQLCFGVLAGTSIVITHSVIPGIVGHMIFNLPYVISECKKIKLKKEKQFKEVSDGK